MSRIFEALIRRGQQVPSSPDSERVSFRAVIAPTGDFIFDEVREGEPAALGAIVGRSEAEAEASGKEESFGRGCDTSGYRTIAVELETGSPIFPVDCERGVEEYRLIRTKIAHHPQNPRVVAVSSPNRGDGKTTTALNVAWALSKRQNTRVLAVDVDFHSSRLSELLGIRGSPGLIDVLRTSCTLEEAVVRLEEYPALYVLPAGETSDGPSDLLDSDNWEGVLKTLRRQFEYVVLDSPPAGVVADYDVVVRACDGVVLVLRPNHTPRELCRKVLASLTGEKLLGVALNDVPDWVLWRHRVYHSYYSESDSMSRGTA